MSWFDTALSKIGLTRRNSMDEVLHTNHLDTSQVNYVQEIIDQLTDPANIIGESSLRDQGILGTHSADNSRITSALVGIYTKTIKNRQEFTKKFASVKNFYLVDGIMLSVAEDALTPDVTTGEVVEMSSQNKEIQEELEKFQELFDFDQIINDIVIDLLSYGEYTLRVDVVKNEGIVKILDDVVQESIIALYDKGLPRKFINHDRKGNLNVVAPTKYIHFALGKFKERIKIHDLLTKKNADADEKLEAFPKYVRLGRPLFYGILPKVKELILLEKLIPAQRINQLTTGSLVEIRLPPSTDPKEGFKISREFENVLNKKLGVDRDTDDLSVTDVLSIAGKIKVVPSFGDKGGLNNIEVKNDRSVDDIFSSVTDTREVICSTVGIPFEIIFGGSNSKGEILKKYARYLRKLKSIQSSIANGLMQFALIHLINKGFDVTPKDIQVRFRNEIVNIDELEKLEYVDAILNIASSYFRFANDINDSESLGKYINKPALMSELKKTLSLMGQFGNCIKIPEGEEDDSPSADDDGDKSSDNFDLDASKIPDNKPSNIRG